MKRLITTCTLLAVLTPADATTIFLDDFSGYAGTGLAPGGAGGALDSNHWAVTGLSQGDSAFGELHDGGDFGRGLASGAVTTGGLYAFTPDPGTSGPALGLQATGTDLTPGLLVLGFFNPLAATVGGLEIGFTLWARNDADRATRIDLLYAGPAMVRAAHDPLAVWHTPGAADALPAWTPTRHETALGVRLAPGDGALFAWSFADAGGGGARDEIALDDVTLRAIPATVLHAPSPLALALAALAAFAAASAGRLKLSARAPKGNRTPVRDGPGR